MSNGSNWKEMDAGQELDIFIARRLGWKIERRDAKEPFAPPEWDEWYAISPDDGDWYIGGVGMHPTENDAWERAHWAPECDSLILHYSTDANAALRLTDLVPGKFVLQAHANEIWQAWFGTPSVPQATEATPALAICRAWLVWNSAQ